IDDWMFSCYEGGERRGRILVIAGDERFGLPATESPDFHPSSFILHPCFPNPFNSTVTIPFELTGSRMQRVAFTIYNTLGQVVYSYSAQTYTPGTHSLFWNGQTNHNTPTSGGVYFLVAATNAARHTTKLIYLP
ncbi:T9SS type A sorting domain-containing protein, partial [bacterium]|nr:T9SS type A sorting domain-containing protein [bacterium]